MLLDFKKYLSSDFFLQVYLFGQCPTNCVQHGLSLCANTSPETRRTPLKGFPANPFDMMRRPAFPSCHFYCFALIENFFRQQIFVFFAAAWQKQN